MLNSLTKVAAVLTVATPLGVLGMVQVPGNDQQATVQEKEIKVDVKSGSPSSDDQGKKKVEVKVLRLDKDGENVKVLVRDVDGKSTEKQNFLGVAIEPVPSTLAMPAGLWKDQGLMVAQVQPDSPAAKAGLKAHDVLVSYDDQKLFTPEQLTKLIRGDKVGREVVLGVVREGQMEKVKATLGEHEVSVAMLGWPSVKGGWIGAEPHKDALRIIKELEDKLPKGKVDVKVRGGFTSMRIESLDGDRMKVEIEYKNEKGDTLKRTFEGSREEIRKQVMADEELPETMREHLLRSLDFGGHGKSGAFRFTFPQGGHGVLDLDLDDLPGALLPGLEKLDRVVELISNDLDPEIREKLKGALRSIDGEQKKQPTPDQSL